MNKNLKRTVATLCVGTMILSATPEISVAETIVMPFNNAQDELIAPHMEYITTAECQLTIRGTTATVSCAVEGDYYDATKAKVIAELQVQNGSDWIPVEIWTVTEDDFEAYVDETHTVVEGHTYRAKATVTVWEGSASETRTLYSEEMTC